MRAVCESINSRGDRVRVLLWALARWQLAAAGGAGLREREQAAYGFEDLVDEMIYPHEVGMSKLDPQIYALVCARLRVGPEEMIFLDDADRCSAGAREVRIHAVRYQDNAQAIEEIEKLLATP